MKYYSRKRNHISSSNPLWELIAIIVIAVLIIVGSDACTAKEWNGGICPDCHTRYELRGVYKGTHYYACPDCGNEVHRFGGK